MPRPKVAGLGKDSRIVHIRLSPDLAKDWDALATREGTTATEAARTVLQFLTSQPRSIQDGLTSLVRGLERQREKSPATKPEPPTVPKEPRKLVEQVDRGRRTRIEIRVTPSELAAVDAIAEQSDCSRQFWITNLIRAALTRGTTVGGAEMKLLAESNRQLMAIGRNLNQLTARINTDADKYGNQLKVEHLERLGKEIARHRDSCTAVIAAASERWRIK